MSCTEKMACPALAAQLEDSFRTTTALLKKMLVGLQGRRMHWASARPSTLQPSAELEQLAGAIAAATQARAGLLTQIAAQLTLPPGMAVPDLHVNVTRIAAVLPMAQGRSLRRAADEATAVAATVRVEVTLGERLLRFTQHAHDGLLGQLAAQSAQPDAAAGYDRSARLRAGLGARFTASKLIDGRI